MGSLPYLSFEIGIQYLSVEKKYSQKAMCLQSLLPRKRKEPARWNRLALDP
jgi:hypothetical protein